MSYYYSSYFTLLMTSVVGLFLFSRAVPIKKKEVSFLIVISMVSGVLCFTFADAEKSAFDDMDGEHFEASFVISEIEISPKNGISAICATISLMCIIPLLKCILKVDSTTKSKQAFSYPFRDSVVSFIKTYLMNNMALY